MQTKYLPENTNPQNTDWLLTENNTPAQKLSVGSLLALAGTPTDLQISDINGLQTVLDNKENISNICPPHPGFISGKYYPSSIIANNSTHINYAAGFVYYTYFFVAYTQTFTRIGFITNSNFNPPQQVRLGIYKIESGMPKTLIVDAGILSFSTSGTKEINILNTLNAGWYAIAITVSPSTMHFIGLLGNLGLLVGQTTISVVNNNGLRASLSFNNFPLNASLTNLTETSAAIVWLKTA